ncbi:MAG: hypothetical protein NTX50_25150 [Candidatus Sumerlaeota bacterium]|nr:hypothetical protein [Candidatus Sumerlaeota bacterium]
MTLAICEKRSYFFYFGFRFLAIAGEGIAPLAPLPFFFNAQYGDAAARIEKSINALVNLTPLIAVGGNRLDLQAFRFHCFIAALGYELSQFMKSSIYRIHYCPPDCRIVSL